MEGIFPKNKLNDSILNVLKEIIILHDVIKTDDRYYKSKHRKIYSFTQHSVPIVF